MTATDINYKTGTIATPRTDITRAQFEARLAEFIPALTAFVGDHYRASYPTLTAPTFVVQRGVKYLRIVESYNGAPRSSYCFLDYCGNIYKCESWKKPAKHIRGSIFNDGFDLGRALNVYGAAYLR